MVKAREERTGGWEKTGVEKTRGKRSGEEGSTDHGNLVLKFKNVLYSIANLTYWYKIGTKILL